MTIVSVVEFEFRSTLSATRVNDVCAMYSDRDRANLDQVCAKFFGLKDGCVHPMTKKPYITALRGGKNNSPEGLAGVFTHVFVVEFETAEDRDYYVAKDPFHESFKQDVGDTVQSIRVIDFEANVY